MTDTRDPRGIATFIVRYLMLQVGLLVLLVLSSSSSLVLLTFICLMGFFTFFQVLIAITRKFLEKAGSWKPVAISGGRILRRWRSCGGWEHGWEAHLTALLTGGL